MRTPIMAGNWKMNKTIVEALDFAKAVKGPLASVKGVEKVICSSFVALAPLADAFKGTDFKLGSQDIYWEEQGAFTGEVSPLMLKEVCQMAIIGHSERRQYFGETDETVNKKIKAALAHGLTPIVCVGESLEQNQAGETEQFVGKQVRAALDGITAGQMADIVIAYEPIWAIGTGLAATADDANRIIGQVVRAAISELYGGTVAGQTRILYGGSVNTKNVEELMQQPDVDGGLVGGASLKPDDYITLAKVAAGVKGSA
ncbi:MAG: triose-phosphate isomerase [Anaerolineae bacterium]|nr:triose-phosphate isomerase [Anaerolineae bacterium]